MFSANDCKKSAAMASHGSPTGASSIGGDSGNCFDLPDLLVFCRRCWLVAFFDFFDSLFFFRFLLAAIFRPPYDHVWHNETRVSPPFWLSMPITSKTLVLKRSVYRMSGLRPLTKGENPTGIYRASYQSGLRGR
jgi:hypothetical protein